MKTTPANDVRNGELLIYVDAENGTKNGKGTADSPMDNAITAYKAAVDALNEGKAENVTVYLLPGEHHLQNEWLMDGKDITASDYHITLTGDKASLSATCPLNASAFTPIAGTSYYGYKLPDGYRDENGLFPAFRDLYFNGKPLTLAMTDRHNGFLKFDSCMRITAAGAAAGVKEEDRLIWVHPHLLGKMNIAAVDEEGYVLAKDAKGNLLRDAEGNPIRSKIELWVKTVWQLQCLHILRILPTVEKDYFRDEKYGEYLVPVEIDAEQWERLKNMQYLTNAPYWFANSIDFLQKPGEFFYDRTVGMIYVYPEKNADMTSAVISFATAERVLHMENMKNVTVKNLTLYGATVNFVTEHGFLGGQGGNYAGIGFLPYGVIYGENAENITVDGCTFNGCGGDSIHFRGIAKNISLVNNKIFASGGAAIRCGKAGGACYDEVQHNENILIKNNYIKGTGCVYTLAAGILVTSVVNLEVSHNTVLDCSYSAMSIGWGWARADGWPSDRINVKNALIAHNFIENYMVNMRDGGAIYTLNANANAGESPDVRLNEIKENYIVTNNNVGNFNTGFWGVVYHDGGSSHWYDHDNVFILPEKELPPPCSYVYYQIHVQCQNNFCMDTERLYIVGYPKDHKDDDTFPENYHDKTNETPVGWYIASGRHPANQNEYEFTKNPETGAYTFSCEYMKTHTLTAKEVYLFRNFGDDSMTKENRKAIDAVYSASGCDLVGGEKTTSAGEMAKTYSQDE